MVVRSVEQNTLLHIFLSPNKPGGGQGMVQNSPSKTVSQATLQLFNKQFQICFISPFIWMMRPHP